MEAMTRRQNTTDEGVPSGTWLEELERHAAARATVVAVGAATVLLFLVLVQVAYEAWTGRAIPVLVVAWALPLAYVAFGLLWRRPMATAGLVWLGAEAALLVELLVVGPGGAPVGQFLLNATSSGFIAAFGAFVGVWLRGMARQPLRPPDWPPRQP
jgi:hypothetical protein